MTETARRSGPLDGFWLLFPRRIAANLELAEAAGLTRPAPNLVQLTLGVLRMQWRLLTRPESVGTCEANPPRNTLRARLLAPRPLRFPFLVAERAVAPLDFSGLASPRERILRHLLGAHHDKNQFAYDLELLAIHPGALEELERRCAAVVDGSDPRAAWLRDLVVFTRYHEELLDAVRAALRDGVRFAPHEENDPDISLRAYLRWCAAQPATMREAIEAIREGRIDFGPYRADTAMNSTGFAGAVAT